MDISIQHTFVPHTDPEASLAFYRDSLGFEVKQDVGKGTMRWITVGPPGDGTTIVLTPPAVDPGITDHESQVIAELMAKGAYAAIVLATPDVDAAFAAIEATGADVVQEPTDQPYGMRDCAFRDPAGAMVRIQQRK